jgi:hypothetical protein
LALSPGHFNVLAAAAARLIALPEADPVEVAHRVDEALARGTPESLDDFRLLLQVLDNRLTGLLLDGRPRNFTALDPAAQDAALQAFRDSRVMMRRSGYQSIRKLCLAAFYASDSTWAAIGYPGPPQISVPS